VASIVVLLSVDGKKILDLLNRLHMMSEGKELATLLGVVALAFALYRAIFITVH
jgi:hypothetical protein